LFPNQLKNTKKTVKNKIKKKPSFKNSKLKY